MRSVFVAVFFAAMSIASIAYAITTSPPAAALFTVDDIKVDATGKSPRVATDLAMAQGRMLAWNRLFHRLTVRSAWQSQPQLDDNQLVALIHSADVGNERRSTTRYLADVNFHFNPAAVRQLLHKSGIEFIDSRAEPALVIPLTAGKRGVDPLSPWAEAWTDPSLQQGLVPLVVSMSDMADLIVPANLTQLDWPALEPIARRHDARQLILAIASEDAKSVQMIEVSATGRTAASFAFARSTFANDAEAVAEHADDEWKDYLSRPKPPVQEDVPLIVDDGSRTHLTVNVQFDTRQDWATLRARLGMAKMVTEIDVVGLALHEALLDLTYFGQIEQLHDALAQDNIDMSSNSEDQYSLALMIGTATADNSP